MTKISDSRLSQTLSSFSLLLLSGCHASTSMIDIAITASTTPTEEFHEPECPATTTA
ncbi:hypothetical protein Alg215_06371 [Pyrenophora tritici-repentis]|nr:hypothetical protein Alg215_06371 [Pyrenophora tritici-repentis]